MRLDTAASLVTVLTPLALARPWTLTDGCPTAIKTIVSSDPCSYDMRGYGCTKDPQWSSMAVVHSALSSCPNITELDLRVTGLGCSEWPDRFNFPFHPVGGEKYPPLKSLRLEGYNFGKSGSIWGRDAWEMPVPYYWTTKFSDDPFWWLPDGNWAGQMVTWLCNGHWRTWKQWRAQPQEQREKTNFALWFDAMDWSSIEELAIIGEGDFTDEMVEKMPSRLQSLRKLEVANSSFIHALDNNTLTHLKWVGNSREGTLPSILEHQGDSLQSLEFRCDELSCWNFARSSDIAILPNVTRNLSHLTINVPRNGTWPLESLQIIASLPHLQSANLYMDIQSECVRQRPSISYSSYRDWEREHGAGYCQGEDQFQKPFVDKQSANELFAHMTEHNPSGQLKNVTFWVGDWQRQWDGPLYDPAWAEGRRTKIVCGTERRTEDDGRCVVEEGSQYWKSRHGRFDGLLADEQYVEGMEDLF